MHIRSRPETQVLPNTERLGLFSLAYTLAGSRVFWCVVAALWGGVLAWRYRHYMNPDGISYLDMATHALRAGPLGLVNRYWSPLYPAFIALWEWIHRPSTFGEFAYIHALNAVLYACAAVSFAYFLHELMRLRLSTKESLAERAVFVAFGFALFFHFMNTDITSFVSTPDLLVAIVAFAAAGLSFRILKGSGEWPAFLTLGVILALGYLAKASMLPAGIVLLCLLFLQSPRSKLRRRGIWIAAAAMFLLSAPQILLVSQRVGHFSISETGRLNYLWSVDGLPAFQGWTGTSGGGVPEHGPKVLSKDPKLIEFASPVSGTYPLWYDPAYWYAGAKPHFDWKGEIHAVKNSLWFYRDISRDLRLPLEGLVMLAILAYVDRRRPGRPELVLLLWPAAILAMYALVYTEYRLVAAFLVILWLAAYSAILTRIGKVESILLAVLAAAMLLSSVRETFVSYRRNPAASLDDSKMVIYWVPPSAAISTDQIAARRLASLGVRDGDPIATIGNALEASYARIARVHVIAEAVNTGQFWSLGAKDAIAAEQILAGTGAKALVAVDRPKGFQSALWESIPGTPYSVLRLRH